MTDVEHIIRERAYQLWIDSGYQNGNAEAHWFAAQRDVLAVSLGLVDPVVDPAPRKKTKPSARRRRAA